MEKILDLLNEDLSKSPSKAAKAVDKVFNFLAFVTQMKVLCLIAVVFLKAASIGRYWRNSFQC